MRPQEGAKFSSRHAKPTTGKTLINRARYWTEVKRKKGAEGIGIVFNHDAKLHHFDAP